MGDWLSNPEIGGYLQGGDDVVRLVGCDEVRIDMCMHIYGPYRPSGN